MVCPHGHGGRGVRGRASADILRTRGEGGQFFAILCERLLWTAPYAYLIYVQMLKSLILINLLGENCLFLFEKFESFIKFNNS